MKIRLFITLFALIGSVITSTAQIPNYVSTNGLLAWWPLDNSGNDQSVNANHFQNFGMTFTTDRFNNPNSAAIGNGTSQYMLCNTPSFSLGANSTFSVSIWVFQPLASYGVGMMHGTTTNNNFIWNFQTSATGDLQFGTNKQGSTWIWTQTSQTINAWNHFVANFNNGAITLYKNGVLAGSNTFTHTAVLQAVLPIYLGRGVSGNYYAGKLDDVGMWNRVLTTQEITDLYNGGCAVSYSAVQVDSLRILHLAPEQPDLYPDRLIQRHPDEPPGV
jgi:trimeric autotransporter adhesin